MLFFSKKKPFLKDLIPTNFIDIHSHLLPAIDDGSPNFETTQGLITDLKQLGFSQFITTPHSMDSVWENSKETIELKWAETQAYFSKKSLPIKLRTAAEYRMDGGFLALIQNKQLLPLKDHLILVEMSYISPPLNLYELLFSLQVAGYQPVLAHPERYSFYHNNTNEYKKLKNAGCLFQLNLLSTVAYYGKSVAKAADYLIENNLFDFVGSDVHHQNHISSFSKKVVIKNDSFLPKLIENNQFFEF